MTADGSAIASTAELTAKPEPTRPRVQSAARAVGILVAVAQSENGLTTREISEQLGIGRQVTYHLLHTLVEAGVLARGEPRRYVLGLRVGTLAEGFARQLAPSEHLAPLIRELAKGTGETSYASGWWSNEITVLTVARGSNQVTAAEVSQGHMGQAHARASGKLLLAYATANARRDYLDVHELAPSTEKTITDRAELEAHLEQIRLQGYSEDLEEFAAGLCCLAVPLDGGLSPFALSLSAPRERYLQNRDQYLAELRRATERR